MASRGARARKVTEQNVLKEEKKHAEKDRADRFARLHLPVVTAAAVAKQPVASKKITHGHSANPASPPLSSSASVISSGSHGSGVSSALGSMFTSADDRKKYAAKGKATTAPRGRGGGVPTKVKNLDSDHRSGSNFSYTKSIRSGNSRSHSISSGLGDHEKSWSNTRLYAGNGQTPRPYPGFENDEEMWMTDGDCLIFFSEETNHDDPRPMLRVHKSILEQAKSTFIINLLRYGEILQEEDDTPPSSAGPTTPPSASQWPLTSTSLGNLDSLLSDDSSSDAGKTPRPADTSRQNSQRDTWSTSDQTIWAQSDKDRPKTGTSRPPMSSAGSTVQTSAESIWDGHNDERHVEITHEIWFRAPSHIKKADIQRRHHMATRNYIALLYGLPIIGNDFYEMLSDLQNVMDTYYELNGPSERWNSAQVIVQYLSQRKLDDVRGNLSHALGLLAWSEQANVLWDAGYLEGFVHSVGMMTQQTMKSKEYRNLSQVTRHKLQMAYNGTQLRLMEAEERLSRFDFPELWFAEGIATGSLNQKAFEAFRDFLYGFYEGEFGRWPPTEVDHQGHWLNRAVMIRLQADFGAVYNYWVDRDIAWDVNENRPSRKWEMVPKRMRAGGFEADSPGFPITDMLMGFDSSQKFDHIPHPYPLVPEARTAATKMSSTRKTILNKFRTKEKDSVPDVKQQYQMALAYNQASNINRLGTTFEDNKLLDAICTYEKTSTSPSMTPAVARLGRWILLYGILQVLSTLSVDTAGLKYKDKIRYYIGPSLDGCPPWRSPEAAPLMIEASQKRSYCWTAPASWSVGQGTQQQPPGYSNHQYELTDPALASPVEMSGSTVSLASPHRGSPLLRSTTSLAGSSTSRTSPILRPSRGVRDAQSSDRSLLMGPPLSSGNLLGNSSLDRKVDLIEEDEREADIPRLQAINLPLRNPRRLTPTSMDDTNQNGAGEAQGDSSVARTRTSFNSDAAGSISLRDDVPQLGELDFSVLDK